MIAQNKHIVILGGGFGGVFAAKRLEALFARDKAVKISLISEQNYLLFTPMLPEIPSSSIEAKHIVSPIRAFFRSVRILNAAVLSIDLKNKVVTVSHCETCGRFDLTFDHLILALGSTTNYFGLPGIADQALPMKTLSDAMNLRNHIIDLFENADMHAHSQGRRAALSVVVAGGGFAGVEAAAEIRDFTETARRYYPRIRPGDVRVVLVHSGSHILPELSESLAEYALRQLSKRKIEVLLNTRVASATSEFVELTDGQRIPTRSLIWTAGVAPSPLLASVPCARNRKGQIIVDEYLEAIGHPGVWAVGDCAEIPDPDTGRPHPPTAQHAIREGRTVAENVAACVRGTVKRAFRYRPLGVMVSLGRRSAVAEVLSFRFSGFFAWWLWRTIYLFKLPGLDRKLRVAMDWTLDLFFPPDTALLKVFTRQAASEAPIDHSGQEMLAQDIESDQNHP